MQSPLELCIVRIQVLYGCISSASSIHARGGLDALSSHGKYPCASTLCSAYAPVANHMKDTTSMADVSWIPGRSTKNGQMHGASTATADMMVFRFMKVATRLCAQSHWRNSIENTRLGAHSAGESNIFNPEDTAARIMTLRKPTVSKGGGCGPKSRRSGWGDCRQSFAAPG